jgi:hypothetical protein
MFLVLVVVLVLEIPEISEDDEEEGQNSIFRQSLTDEIRRAAGI